MDEVWERECMREYRSLRRVFCEDSPLTVTSKRRKKKKIESPYVDGRWGF